MGEYIKDQTASTTIQPGDYLVFDTLTDTYKITRQNLLGQMDQNKIEIASNAADISTNAGNISTNTSAINTINNNILEVSKTVLTTGELLDLYATPQAIIPISGGPFIQIVDITVAFYEDGLPFSSVGDLQILSGSSILGTIPENVMTTTDNMIAKMLPNTNAVSLAADDVKIGLPATPATGSGTLIVSSVFKRIS